VGVPLVVYASVIIGGFGIVGQVTMCSHCERECCFGQTVLFSPVYFISIISTRVVYVKTEGQGIVQQRIHFFTYWYFLLQLSRLIEIWHWGLEEAA
jgi:hypothetical protein